jgi:hypothetical protein
LANRFALSGTGTETSWWDQHAPTLMHPQNQGGSFGGPTPAGPATAMGTPSLTQSAPAGGSMPNVYGSQSGALTGGGGPTPGNEQAWFMQLVGNRPWNQATFNELAPTLQQYGFKITPPNAVGDQTKIQLPNGQWVRVGFGEGHPVWIPQNNAGGASAAGGAGGAYTGPGAIPPPFQAPSFADLQKEPGFQARLAMGQQGLEHSAAAQGSLLSGGFQKSLNRYSQDYASSEYGNAYNRAFNTYMGNYQTQSADPWSRYAQLYSGGLSAALGSKTTPPLGG